MSLSIPLTLIIKGFTLYTLPLKLRVLFASSPERGRRVLFASSPERGRRVLFASSPERGRRVLFASSPERGRRVLFASSPERGLRVLFASSPERGLRVLFASSPLFSTLAPDLSFQYRLRCSRLQKRRLFCSLTPYLTKYLFIFQADGPILIYFLFYFSFFGHLLL